MISIFFNIAIQLTPYTRKEQCKKYGYYGRCNLYSWTWHGICISQRHCFMPCTLEKNNLANVFIRVLYLSNYCQLVLVVTLKLLLCYGIRAVSSLMYKAKWPMFSISPNINCPRVWFENLSHLRGCMRIWSVVPYWRKKKLTNLCIKI